MFIYFWEQVWTDENTYRQWNVETEEIQARFWDQWHYQNRGSAYPRGSMELGVDHVEW